MENIEKIRNIIRESKNIVFFGGAGVSTASNIPDFRSATGLYNKSSGTKYTPEYMLSHEFFMDHPEEFSNYYKKNLIYPDAKPNNAHKSLKKLEDQNKLKGIITQNIDGLHQMAGSKKVIEIHGNLIDFYCLKCNEKYDVNFALKEKGITFCSKCGGIVRPDVVLYGEQLDMKKFNEAINLIENADVFIVGGTSLLVYPASNLINFYNKNKLILINKEKTPKDDLADYVIHGDISKVLPEII